jgi:hypothetical protein
LGRTFSFWCKIHRDVRRKFLEKLSQKNLKSGNGKSLTKRLWNLRQSGDTQLKMWK